jgi:hypothetical protein
MGEISPTPGEADAHRSFRPHDRSSPAETVGIVYGGRKGRKVPASRSSSVFLIAGAGHERDYLTFRNTMK